MKILEFEIYLLKLKILLKKYIANFCIYQGLCTPDLSDDVLQSIGSEMALNSSHYHLTLNSTSHVLIWEQISCFYRLQSFLFKNIPFLLATAPLPQLPLLSFSFIFNS